MRWSYWGGVVVLCAVLAPLAGCVGAGSDTDDLLVLAGRVIDGTGSAPIEGGVVVVEGERIRTLMHARTIAGCSSRRG